MKSEITLTLRSFPVLAHDHRTGEVEAVTVSVTKEQLKASQLVGQGSTELIERMLDRQGYTVIEIGIPDKRTITLDLDKLVERYDTEQDERNKWNYLNGIDGEGQRCEDQ